eukprot:scaffold32710_cov33-Tisochrysis_lutea.AAC.1
MPSTCPTAALGGILAVEAVVLLLVAILVPRRGWGGHHELWHVLSAGLLGSGLAHFLTECLKKYCGYLRPNFYAACQFDDTVKACVDEVLDLRHSFPSGHSSSSMVAGVLVCLYLLRIRHMLAEASLRSSSCKASPFESSIDLSNVVTVPPVSSATADARGAVQGGHTPVRSNTTHHTECARHLLAVGALLPVILALWVASTRVHDNKHHPADVVAGAVLGAACATFAFSVCFSSRRPMYIPVTISSRHQGGHVAQCDGSGSSGVENTIADLNAERPWRLC